MTITMIVGAVFIAGFIIGAVFTASIASAAMHRSQTHMQRKVRHWQGRWRQARRYTRHVSL
jgi:hypothetical protein